MGQNSRESSVRRGGADFCESRKVTFRKVEPMRAHISEGRAKRRMDLGKSGKWGSFDEFIRSFGDAILGDEGGPGSPGLL